jgi:hypothetical protein
VKHLFHYLKGTLDYKIVYKPDLLQQPFVCYSDADYGGDKDNGKCKGNLTVLRIRSSQGKSKVNI